MSGVEFNWQIGSKLQLPGAGVIKDKNEIVMSDNQSTKRKSISILVGHPICNEIAITWISPLNENAYLYIQAIQDVTKLQLPTTSPLNENAYLYIQSTQNVTKVVHFGRLVDWFGSFGISFTVVRKSSGLLYPFGLDCSSLLHANQIIPQVYHSTSCIGNHCHRYFKHEIYQQLIDTLVTKT